MELFQKTLLLWKFVIKFKSSNSTKKIANIASSLQPNTKCRVAQVIQDRRCAHSSPFWTSEGILLLKMHSEFSSEFPHLYGIDWSSKLTSTSADEDVSAQFFWAAKFRMKLPSRWDFWQVPRILHFGLSYSEAPAHSLQILVVGWGTMLQVGRSRVRFPMRSLDFSMDLILSPTLLSGCRLSLY
jgi:hypothetical protein